MGGERFRGNSYTSEEVKKLQKAVMGTEIEVPVMLALTLALRRSEVIGLRWSALDFEHDVVHINHTCVIQDNKPKYVDLTKNASSHADMYLSKLVKEYLTSVKKRQEEDKNFYGKGYVDSDYVCRHSDGSLIKPNYVSQNFPKFLEANNLKRIRFHDLRYISGSIVLNSTGDLKLTSEYLRHSSIQVTGDIYSHVDLGRKKTIVLCRTSQVAICNQSYVKLKRNLLCLLNEMKKTFSRSPLRSGRRLYALRIRDCLFLYAHDSTKQCKNISNNFKIPLSIAMD